MQHTSNTFVNEKLKKMSLKMGWGSLIIFPFVITIVTIELWVFVKLLDDLAEARLRFDSYLRDFNKTYSVEEYETRLENFKESLKDIARFNKREGRTVFGLTKFSDMSDKEFADRMLLKQPIDIAPCTFSVMNCEGSQTRYEPLINKTLRDNPPTSFDWRKEGVVKPVLNQKLCQGCWAFSIVGVLESMAAIQKKDYNSRSIQELLDCSTYNNGCNFGNVRLAMDFICIKKLQFVTEEEYPLTLSMDRICKLPEAYSGRTVKEFQHNCSMNEDEMVQLLAFHGPLVAAVDSSNWKNYIGGVIQRACTRGISNHVVQIVGYEGYGGADKETPIPYYIIRNSFGEDFGDHGYVKIAMNDDVCGIAEQITFFNVL